MVTATTAAKLLAKAFFYITLKSDGSTVSIGQINITNVNRGARVILVSESEVTLPEDISPMDLRQVTLSDSAGLLLVADIVNAPGNSLSILNGRVQVLSSNPAVHGNALLQTSGRHGKQSGRFTMVVQGLTRNTTYHVVVDGTDPGAVKSARNGLVVLRILPGTNLTTLSSVQLQDNSASTVAEATF